MEMGGQRHAPAALPPGKTRCLLYRWLGGPQGRSGRVRKMWPSPGFDPRTVQPVASRYNCAISAHEFTRKRPQMLTYTRQIQSTSLHTTSLSSILKLFSNYRICLQSSILPSGSPTKMVLYQYSSNLFKTLNTDSDFDSLMTFKHSLSTFNSTLRGFKHSSADVTV
jgi:hypothetical protein